MCGIFGYIGIGAVKPATELEKFKNALSEISYRGPDNSSFKIFSSENSENYNIFFGHNRLSIIDLSKAGNQPFSINDKYHIVFNGEIYNYVEIREDLKSKGYEFKTNSDTEVLLNLYIESGTKRFGELNGMWAFLIYDQVNNCIIASRDRFGVKPMYILENENEIYFASEIKQLLLFKGYKSINSAVLSNYLHHYLLDYSDDTFFDGIKKLPAMHSLSIDLASGKQTFDKYWDFTSIDFSEASELDILNQYKELLTSSIQIRLRSDVKVGNTLSGGLDSSSIAVLAHQLTSGNFFNYSVISNNKDISEEKYVDYLIEFNKVNVKKINFDQSNPWSQVNEVIWHHDEPILSLSTIAHYQMLGQLKMESDIIVVLSGQGGDESLAGYNKYFFFNIRDLLSQGKYLGALKEMAALAPRVGSEFKWNFAKRYIPFLQKIKSSDDALSKIIRFPKPDSVIGAASSLKERQILDITKYSVPSLCHYEDRNSMAHSLEIRLPFLDFRLVNFSLNLPNHLKIRNGVNKQILRKTMDELPLQLRNRFDKKGFTIDEKVHQNAYFFQLLNKSFKESALGDLGAINVDFFRNEVLKMKDFKSGLWERDLHRILFAEIWAKKFL
jgi:asparagine synthase (glutamine-hydrolysing)